MILYKNSLYFLTKKQLSFYDLFEQCYLECEYTKDLTSSVFEKLRPYHVFFKNKKNKLSSSMEHINSLYGIKNSGEMFTYGCPTVPYMAQLISYPHYTENGVETAYYGRFYAYTIDDSSMSFMYGLESIDNYTSFIEKVRTWLNTFTNMPSAEDFEKYWSNKGGHDFDYN